MSNSLYISPAYQELLPKDLLLGQLKDIVVGLNNRGDIILCNQQAIDIYQYPSEEFFKLTIHQLDCNFAAHTWDVHWATLKRNESLNINVLHRSIDGRNIAMEIVDSYIIYNDIELSIFIARDKTRQEEFQQRLQMMQFSMDQVTDSVFWINNDGLIIYANDAATRNLGYANDELLDMYIYQLDEGLNLIDWEEHWQQLYRRRTHNSVTHFHLKRGDTFPAECSHNYVESANAAFICTFVRDITERHRQEQQLLHLSHHDKLTGLPNRQLLEDRLEQAISHASRHDCFFAILFIDLDHFKEVNDTYGHKVGDELLKVISRRLSHSVRSGDTVARHGGDEFIILLNELSDSSNVEQVVKEILEKMSQPVEFEHYLTLDVSGSVGIAIYPGDGLDEESLFMHADIAMYRAKAKGRNCYKFYNL